MGREVEGDAELMPRVRLPACPSARARYWCASDLLTDENPWYDWGLAPLVITGPCPSPLNSQ